MDNNAQSNNNMNEDLEDDDLIKEGEFTDSSDSESTEEEMLDEHEFVDSDEMADIEARVNSSSSKSGDKTNSNTKNSSKSDKKVYIPGQKMPKGTVLEADESAYIMRHEFGLDTFPAYSFDYITTHPDSAVNAYPMTTYFACGTSAGRSRKNQLIFAKISNVHRHKQKKNEDDISDSESESSDSEDEDESKKEAKLPRLIKAEVPYKGGINKVRNLDQFTAVFGENKKVAIYDNTKAMEALNDIDKKKAWFFRVKQKKGSNYSDSDF